MGAIYLHRRANTAGLHWATNEVVRRQDTRARTRPVHVTLPQASGHSGGGGKTATFFMRNPLDSSASFKSWNLGESHLSYAATQRSPPRASAPKTSEEGINDQMKSAESLHMRGTGGTGRLQNTQEKGRAAVLSSREANAYLARNSGCRPD